MLTEMANEIAVSPVFTTLPEAPLANSDAQLLEIWLHGRSRHTQRAYRADVEHFLASTGKPFLFVFEFLRQLERQGYVHLAGIPASSSDRR